MARQAAASPLRLPATANRHDEPSTSTSVGALVSFVIPARNEERYLKQCLASIQALDLPESVHDVEVIVVDNESTDSTATLATEMGAKVLSVPPGRPSRARNAGAAVAEGDWIAFVDADCILPPDWLSACAVHLNQADVAAVGTTLASPERNDTWVQHAWFEITRPRNASDRFDEVGWLPAFNLLVKRSAFERVGRFDESMVTCEDSDLGYRLTSCGRLIRETAAPTVHLGESRTLRELFRREAWRCRGNWQILRKYGLTLREAISIALPPLYILAIAMVLIGGIFVAVRGEGVLLWGVAGGAVAAFPVAFLLLRRALSADPLASARRVVVLVTYLAARAFGLTSQFSRVERR